MHNNMAKYGIVRHVAESSIYFKIDVNTERTCRHEQVKDISQKRATEMLLGYVKNLSDLKFKKKKKIFLNQLPVLLIPPSLLLEASFGKHLN